MSFLHTLQPTHPLKSKKRIGRGGKRGTYSGKGQKGQRARSGAHIRPVEREMILKIPKKRGTGFINKPKKFATPILTINVNRIAKAFESGQIVSVKTLVKKGLVHISKREKLQVKILGTGKLSKKLSFVGVSVSQAARTMIEAAGGTINSPFTGISRKTKSFARTSKALSRADKAHSVKGIK